jgi:hypothetical protein
MINIQYLYLDEENPENAKIFQDSNSQIVGLQFKKSQTNKIVNDEYKLKYIENNCIYFLVNSEEIYIGKSANGVQRINNHVSGKKFWNYAIMFITDNNSWTSTTVDYLEFHYINQFQKLVDYTLENTADRKTSPNITKYDRANIDQIIKKIDFYLNINGINTENKINNNHKTKLYFSKDGNSSIYYDNGFFYLKADSKVKKPNVGVLNYSDNGNLYHRLVKTINDLVESNLVDKNSYKTKQDIQFSSISRIASLVTGRSANGWDYFENVNELRSKTKGE